RMSDDDARMILTRIKGIGLWSADVYLLMAMRRADIWPSGDLALAVAMKDLNGLPKTGARTAPSLHACCGSITSEKEISLAKAQRRKVNTLPLRLCAFARKLFRNGGRGGSWLGYSQCHCLGHVLHR